MCKFALIPLTFVFYMDEKEQIREPFWNKPIHIRCDTHFSSSTGPAAHLMYMQAPRDAASRAQRDENRRQTINMTVLIAWGSLSVGIVMGAMWRSLFEKQSRSHTDIGDGSVNFHRLTMEPQQHRERQQRPACWYITASRSIMPTRDPGPPERHGCDSGSDYRLRIFVGALRIEAYPCATARPLTYGPRRELSVMPRMSEGSSSSAQPATM
jgi:hypothetical protein